jgi:hypothetical protein
MYNDGLIEEMIGWQEEEEEHEIFEFCSDQQRISFKKNFTSELDQITNGICEDERRMLVSIDPSLFVRHLADYINVSTPKSEYTTYKTKSDYYLLMNLKNQTIVDRKVMIDAIVKLWRE